MPQKTNLNVAPYYDDFTQDKNFYKVLFRPGYSIQARELTQLQSILQNQIESFGKYAFKQGELVIPGEIGINTKLPFVKLSSVSEIPVNVNGQIVYKKYDVTSLKGQVLKGLTSGVTATVIESNVANDTASDVLFVNYTNSGDAGNEDTFRQGETLEVVDGVNTPLLVVGTDGSVLPTSISITDPDTGVSASLESPAMGYASAVQVEEGIYFVNGYFVRNAEQLLVIDNYYDKPSSNVGFKIEESLVTSEEDESLYDNAIGSTNYTSPGAHRLKITLTLTKYPLGQITDKNFIQLISVRNGSVQTKVVQTNYSLLEQTLARRTYDESGDYVVDDFSLGIREYYQQGGNLGVYTLDDLGNVNNIPEADARNKLIATVGSGKAYVKGFEIVNKETKYLPVDKARESLTRSDIRLKTKGLPTYRITNTYGAVPLNADGAQLTAYPNIFLCSNFNDGSIGLNNTESDTGLKQTLNRRGTYFGINDGLKTVYVKITPQVTLNQLDGASSPATDNFEKRLNSLISTKLWVVQSRNTVQTPTLATSFDIVAYSEVKRLECGSDTYLELTLKGNKDYLDDFLTEYDSGNFDPADPAAGSYSRDFFRSEADAKATTNQFGNLVDYNETITPIIGTVKPSNFTLVEKGNGFNPDSDVVVSKGRQDNGDPSYNTTFGFSYFDPQFFTRILLDDPITDTNGFTSGKYVYGSVSGAYGIVEGESGEGASYTKNKTLMLKVLSGTFVSGETITDEDNNSLKIARDNTISHFVINNRGVGYDDGCTIRVDGVDYDAARIEIIKPNGIDKILDINIKDREFVKTEYSRPPVVTIIQPPASNAPSTVAVITPVLVRNAVTTYTPQNAKSFFCDYGSGNANTFTSDIEVNKDTYTEVKAVTQFTFSGSEGRKYIECNGFGGDATKFLQHGDLVQFTDSSDTLIRAIVQYATLPSGVLKSRIYLDRSLPNEVTNTSVVRVRPSIDNFNGGSLLYKTGTKEISSIVANSEDSKITYYARRDFVTPGNTSGGLITFSAQLPFGTQRFVSFDESNFIITVLDPGDATDIAKGDIVYVTSDQVIISASTDAASGLTSGAVKLQLPSTYFGGDSNTYSSFPVLKLTATLEITKAKPRIKTAVENKRIVVDAGGDKVIPFRGNDYDTSSVETYTYSDAYKLRYVYEGSPTEPPTADRNGNLVNGTDVTNRFTFDDGQRDTIYDVSRLIIKPGAQAPVGKLLIAFDYFEHTQGDFCTVDSYLHEAGVSPEDVPTFNSPALGKVSLKDVLDFRPKIDNSSIVAGFDDKSLLSSGSTRVFAGSGGVVASTPAPDDNLEFTFSFTQTQYLNRIDGVFLNKKGSFIVKKGNSSLNPSKPDPINDAIPLYYLYIPAFTQSSKDVRIVPVDNKRYTMRDIGKLEKRIERLEYYTTLSILEQQALNMHITDSAGINRFKSGFIVDNFETHKIGSLGAADYQCSIDTQQSVMRPQSKEDSYKLEEINTRDDQRAVSGYRKTGDRVTLPYSDLELLGNSFATKTINPNPFVVLQYVGDSFVGPSVDSWYDSSVAPLVTDNNTNLYSIFLAKNQLRDAFSSLYNSYKVNWIGANRSFFNINSFADVNGEIADSTVTNAIVNSSSNISPENNEIGKGLSTKGVGSNVVATSLSFFARSIPIKFVVNRLKPNTNIHVFMEGQNIARWVNPDNRYTGVGGNSLSSFNSPITTDENGNASGIILVPAGKPPRENTSWTGDVSTVDYDDSASEVRFSTGVKTIRFTSSSTDLDKEGVETYAEVKYYATGIVPDNPSSIVSTSPAFFKSNEGTQVTDSNTENPIRPNPLAQTFTVSGFDGGLFTTGVDLFFSQKSDNIPIRVYLTDVDNGKPGKNIIPGTQKVITPDTYLRVVASDTLTITKGEKITGASSNASGPVSRVFDRNNIELIPSTTGLFSLASDQVYTAILDNHNGTSFNQDESLVVPSITAANNANNTTLSLKIVKDSGRVTDLKVSNAGASYDSAIVTIESPQLPGGGNATATVRVSGGKVYHTELVLSGSEYTEPPAVIIRGTGTGNAGAVIESSITIDTPAVRMGIAIDEVGVTASTTPTKFVFDYPVYLQNDTEYALVLETDSIDYLVWASKLGEVEIATSTIVTTQPALGSLFKSQNTNAWTEDLFEDLKFKMYRAEFDISKPSSLILTNEDLGYEALDDHPFETNASSETNATSSLFKNNNSIIKINHSDNGFDSDDNSYVFFKGSKDTGGFIASELNSELYQVKNTGLDHYNVKSVNQASGNVLGGGTNVLASYNRKFEKVYALVPNLTFSQTSIETSIKTTNVSPVDDSIKTFASYTQSDYEKTFLNEDFFFINQKILASRVNETMNNIDNSLTYKIDLSSTVSHLSPLIDLSRASIKTISNRIENAKGQEDRFGRRDQILNFYPVYTCSVVNNTGTPPVVGMTVQGMATNSEGVIINVNSDVLTIKVKTVNVFTANEGLKFGGNNTQSSALTALNPDPSTPTTPKVTITSAGVLEKVLSIPNVISPPSIVFARDVASAGDYNNKISGEVVLFNPKTKTLKIVNDKQPISDDYISDNTNVPFARVTTSATNTVQQPDIFRVGDIIGWTGQTAGEESYTEISSITYTNGIDYVSDTQSKDSSSLAGYVTKEVSIENPGTSIDVKLTANTTEIENIKVLYRTKKSSSQENFEDIEWIEFNGTGLPDVDIIASAENSISGITEKQSSYQELTYSVDDLPEFSSFAIKVVMKTSNPAFVPKIQDLRAVASY